MEKLKSIYKRQAKASIIISIIFLALGFSLGTLVPTSITTGVTIAAIGLFFFGMWITYDSVVDDLTKNIS